MPAYLPVAVYCNAFVNLPVGYPISSNKPFDIAPFKPCLPAASHHL
jgi:hypothetical protein|nr:MAG TPA: hypothetical protein [Caudoviricetes sp.]